MTDWIPLAAIVLATVACVALARVVIARRHAGASRRDLQFQRQAWTIGIVLLGTLASVLALPDSVDGNLAFSVIGLVVTGALAISSQSIIANGMSGIMLRIIKNFGPGDFIEVDEHHGRVSDMGLFHTEIQTADRDLVTLPNLLMVNKPVRVVRKSGTIVSVRVGIGYDVPRLELKALFVEAAAHAKLEEPFVQVVDLGDYAVTYRVAGFLAESTQVLAARSRLRSAILDTLSDAGVEIMSPMYVARRDAGAEPVIPELLLAPPTEHDEPSAADKAFDKADLAADALTLRAELADAQQRVEDLEELHAAQSEERAQATLVRLEATRRRAEELADRIAHIDSLHATEE